MADPTTFACKDSASWLTPSLSAKRARNSPVALRAISSLERGVVWDGLPMRDVCFPCAADEVSSSRTHMGLEFEVDVMNALS